MAWTKACTGKPEESNVGYVIILMRVYSAMQVGYTRIIKDQRVRAKAHHGNKHTDVQYIVPMCYLTLKSIDGV